MVKKLVILGDSFCHGIGTVHDYKCVENTNKAFGFYLAKHLNFNCFTEHTFEVKCPHSFLDVWHMHKASHPTIEQHQKMAQLLKGYL